MILIILNDTPYGNERSYNGLRLALSLAKSGEDLRIFLMADAVMSALPAQSTPKGYYNIERMINAVIGTGAEIKACGSCSCARGIKNISLINGVEISTITQLAKWTAEADKVLTF